MATTTTTQPPQDVVAPPQRYTEVYTWEIDTKTNQLIRVRKEITPS